MRAALLLVLLGGCALVDQNTFNSHAGDVPVVPAVPKPAVEAARVGPPPFLVITGVDPASYLESIRTGVAAARARKADVAFDVVEMQPADAPADAALGERGVAVARAIVAQGVPAGRVRLVARPEAGVGGEVRVYVR